MEILMILIYIKIFFRTSLGLFLVNLKFILLLQLLIHLKNINIKETQKDYVFHKSMFGLKNI